MDWKTLFFGFDGRIGRKQWWAATVLAIAVSLAMSMLVNPLAWFGDPPAPTNATDMMLSLAFLIPMTAINIKRGNDRDWPQWIIYGYSLLTLALLVYDYFFTMFARAQFDAIEIGLLGVVTIATVVLFIDLGTLAGTRGPNRHGADPIAQSSTEQRAS
ncbi:MAG: DUF805 domain-containing protein [Hyphomicrobiaceae bacterium]